MSLYLENFITFTAFSVFIIMTVLWTRIHLMRTIVLLRKVKISFWNQESDLRRRRVKYSFNMHAENPWIFFSTLWAAALRLPGLSRKIEGPLGNYVHDRCNNFSKMTIRRAAPAGQPACSQADNCPWNPSNMIIMPVTHEAGLLNGK